ncbi:MAG: helix-turn-helix domain-containing protein [Candidatus Acidiferrales bacterium]
MQVAAEEKKNQQLRIEVPLAQRLALTLAECCALSGLKMYQLRFAIRDGELAFIQNGKRGQYVIRREALEKFLRAKEQREVAR